MLERNRLASLLPKNSCTVGCVRNVAGISFDRCYSTRKVRVSVSKRAILRGSCRNGIRREMLEIKDNSKTSYCTVAFWLWSLLRGQSVVWLRLTKAVASSRFAAALCMVALCGCLPGTRLSAMPGWFEAAGLSSLIASEYHNLSMHWSAFMIK